MARRLFGLKSQNTRSCRIFTLLIMLIIVSVCSSLCLQNTANTTKSNSEVPRLSQTPTVPSPPPSAPLENMSVTMPVTLPVTFIPDYDITTPSELVRKYFDERYPLWRGTGYPIELDRKDSDWLASTVPEAEFIQSYAEITRPPLTVSFLHRNKMLYAMPDAFNPFMGDAQVSVSTDEEARGVAYLYAQVWEPRGLPNEPTILVLDSARDIPIRTTPVPPAVTNAVKSPDTQRLDGIFTVHFFSWSTVNGIVREWRIQVSPNGNVTAKSQVIAQSVGAYHSVAE